MLDVVLNGRLREALRRVAIDLIVGRVGNIAAGMRDPGKMDHDIHAGQQ